ncbi:MAG: hypothetical protein R3B07_21450 [Polyangiaceae bacterium]
MRRQSWSLGLLGLVVACGGSPPPAAEAPEAAPAAPPPVAEQVEVEPPPAEPTKEELAAQKLVKDFAEMEASADAEDKRWTPELHAEAKKLAETKYANLNLALKAVLKGGHRMPGHPERDASRHPAETLAFFGLKPGMKVLEYGPGEGWYTEVLAPTLAASGMLYVTSGDPAGPRTVRGTMYAQRTDRFLKKAPELYGKVQPIIVDSKAPDLKLDGQLDMVLVIRGMHGWHRDGQVDQWLQQIFKSLKKGGVLGVVQHRAKADANPDESTKQGYLPEAFVIERAQAAGFKLSKKSEINANPKDTTEHPEGVWTLPPTLRLGDKDRDEYTAIGESDRMTLRFVKP